TDSGTSGSTGGDFCLEGDIVCEDGVSKVCDGDGGWLEETPCDDECADGIGCVLCVPGSTQCNGDAVEVCNGQGDAWEPGETCDGLQGLECDADLGQCVGACAGLGLSYIGCDYYPTVTLQYDLYNTSPKDDFAVAVANTSGQTANVTVTRGAMMVTQYTVAPNSVQVTTLPWVNALTKGNGPTVKVTDGAYRLRSDQPVTVYQFNPLKSTTTNDASLLLPVNTWQFNYMIATWGHWTQLGIPSFYAVIAKEDGTTVTLNPSATGGQVQAGAGVAGNGTGQVALDEGDVLEVISAGGDLTGTIVSSDKPVQVFGGHKCTNVPFSVAACDHLEESMFPIETLAKEYVVVPPVQVPNNNLAKAQMVRVIASEDDTELVFEPNQGVNTMLNNAGDFVELPTTTAAFKVSSEKKIMVAQYMVGQNAGYGTSDPSMLLTVPAEQYRTEYLFFAETNWVENFVDIIAPDGATVSVDGANVNGWSQVGNTGFSVAHVKLNNGGGGTHSVQANQKVGISVY
ncbi:MAG: IgGFc-binding protein, partial [Myxococcales bacterium]|nr:IgGFc-binding protein [Myxococcales bacterium]